MAKMTTEERTDTAAEFMRQRTGPVSVLKDDIAAAVAAVDDWIEANAASFNSALPVSVRSTFTA